jgi:Tfp pilus assembly protein PilN
MKRNIISLSILVSLVAVALVVLLALYVHGAQVLARNQLQDGINKDSKQLQSMSNLDKVLTVQDALVALPTLHNQLPVDSRLFDYLKVLVPDQVELNKIDLEQVQSPSLTLSAHSQDYKALNIFADTLKNAQLKFGSSEQKKSEAAFSNVAITQASESSDAHKPGVDFTLTMGFNPKLFSASTANPTMNVPTVTTGQGLAKSNPVFNSDSSAVPATTGGQ